MGKALRRAVWRARLGAATRMAMGRGVICAFDAERLERSGGAAAKGSKARPAAAVRMTRPRVSAGRAMARRCGTRRFVIGRSGAVIGRCHDVSHRKGPAGEAATTPIRRMRPPQSGQGAEASQAAAACDSGPTAA